MEKIKKSTILYIEDDDVTRDNISSYLMRQCKCLYIGIDGKDGFDKFMEHKPDIVITDIEMPNMNGLEMAKKIRKESKETQIVITTAYTNPEYLMQAVNLHLVQYIVKPISLPKLTSALEDCENFLDEVEDTRKHIHENLFYDVYTKELVFENDIVSLSKNERSLIELLIKNYPAPTSYEAIETNVYEFATSKNAIKLLIKSLRNKLSKDAISNVSGFGYNITLVD